MTKAVSVEGAIARYTSGRLAGGYINAWNVGARISLMPFGVIHNRRILDGWMDGALELGLEPAFERFNTVHQNYVGVLAEARYYFVRLHYGPFLPWIGAAIGPGYSDLNIGRVDDDNKLTGPFMALIKGEAGVAWLVDNRTVLYAGLEAQHVSNGSLNGKESNGATTNLSLNTPWGLVVGCSWVFR